jgi:alkylhydroperoxidase family enzyme
MVAMGSLGSLDTAEVIARVLPAGTPLGEVADEMVLANEAAWSSVDATLLDVCRLRIAMLLGCKAEQSTTHNTHRIDAIGAWPTDPRFDAQDRSALAFTEHYLFDVASLDDETANELKAHLGDNGLQNFVAALLIVEQRIRLRLVWDRLGIVNDQD